MPNRLWTNRPSLNDSNTRPNAKELSLDEDQFPEPDLDPPKGAVEERQLERQQPTSQPPLRQRRKTGSCPYAEVFVHDIYT